MAPGRLAAANGSPQRLSSAAAEAALPPGSPAGPLPLRPSYKEQAAGPDEGEDQRAGTAEGAGAAAAEPLPSGFAGLPEGLPPLLSPDYAVNAFLARLAFDLLRRPDFTVRTCLVGHACAT